MNNVISESLSLQNRILLQQVPYEGEYLKMVMDAMKKSVRIAVEYRKYGTDKPNHLNFEPYCIKLFKQRWYILGHFHRDATEEKPESDYFGVFSFDRILEMSLTDIKFKIDPDFDAQEWVTVLLQRESSSGPSAMSVSTSETCPFTTASGRLARARTSQTLNYT